MPPDGILRRYNFSSERTYTFKIRHATPLLLIVQLSRILAEQVFTHDNFRTYRKANNVSFYFSTIDICVIGSKFG